MTAIPNLADAPWLSEGPLTRLLSVLDRNGEEARVIGGAVLIVDIKLLGYGIRTQTLAEVARDAQKWFLGSWAVMISTGLLLFWSEPQKLYYSTPFAVKMICLLLGTVFALTVRRKVAQAGEGRVPPVVMKLVALVSLMLWFGVGAGGRWIGFSG